jgi:hypothetical protein
VKSGISLADYRGMVAAQKREQNGRFGGEYTSRELLFEVLEKVARVADPERPERVSMRAWTAHRAKAGYADAPTANAVHLRLNAGPRKRSWSELLAAACDQHRNQSQTLAAAFRAPADHDLDDDGIYYALRVVARENGWQTFTLGQYDEARLKLLQRDARRKHGGVLPDLLPTGQQIEHHTKGWPAALALAELKPLAPRARAHTRRGGASGDTYWDAERMIEALRAYVREYPDHDEAGNRDYKERAVGRDWPSASVINNHGYNFRDLLAEAKRRERGEQPQEVPRRRASAAGGSSGRRGAYKWTPERIEQELREYLADKDHLPGGTAFRKDGKEALYGAIRKHGGIEHWAEVTGKPHRPRPGSRRSRSARP